MPRRKINQHDRRRNEFPYLIENTEGESYTIKNRDYDPIAVVPKTIPWEQLETFLCHCGWNQIWLWLYTNSQWEDPKYKKEYQKLLDVFNHEFGTDYHI